MALRCFSSDRTAGVAPLLALAAVPLFAAAGAAVTYSRTNAARVAMQSAANATALMLAKELQAASLIPMSYHGVPQVLVNFGIGVLETSGGCPIIGALLRIRCFRMI